MGLMWLWLDGVAFYVPGEKAEHAHELFLLSERSAAACCPLTI